MAQSVDCWTLGFPSGSDLGVVGLRPCGAPHLVGSLLERVSPSAPAPTRLCSLINR